VLANASSCVVVVIDLEHLFQVEAVSDIVIVTDQAVSDIVTDH